MIDWKPEAISAAWRAFNDASENPMREAINAAIEKNGIEELDTQEFYEAGYADAIEDVSGLIENWKSDDAETKANIVNAVRKMKANG
jgi:hypothetical protein